MRYWREALIAAFEDMDLAMPSEDRLDMGANVLEGAHENYSMAHGHHCIPDPVQEENKQLEKALRDEKRKENCHTCNGRGRIEHAVGTSHFANTECHKCNGEGRVMP